MAGNFKVIRAADDYSLVIVVTPADAKPETMDTATFYRWVTWAIGDNPLEKFHEISGRAAISYFSGHADGLGLGRLPDETFESLEDVEVWIRAQRRDETVQLRLIGIATHETKRAPMQPAQSARLVKDVGIEGDKPRNSRTRQVTVLSAESWHDACLALGQGALAWTIRRANFLVAGKKFGPEDKGKVLRIGDAVLLITGECDPCHRMDEQVPGLQEALRPEWRGGVCAVVLEGGDVTLDMEATLAAAA